MLKAKTTESLTYITDTTDCHNAQLDSKTIRITKMMLVHEGMTAVDQGAGINRERTTLYL